MGILEELRRDLVDPVKTFAEDVYSDTIGDAKQFYYGQAKSIQQRIKRAEIHAQEKAAAIMREKEEVKKLRKAMMKKVLIILAAVIAFSLIVFPLLLSQSMQVG